MSSRTNLCWWGDHGLLQYSEVQRNETSGLRDTTHILQTVRLMEKTNNFSWNKTTAWLPRSWVLKNDMLGIPPDPPFFWGRETSTCCVVSYYGNKQRQGNVRLKDTKFILPAVTSQLHTCLKTVRILPLTSSILVVDNKLKISVLRDMTPCRLEHTYRTDDMLFATPHRQSWSLIFTF